MPTIIATPNPTKPERIDVDGTGFNPAMNFITLIFDGTGSTIKIPIKRDGSFSVGQYIASTRADKTYRLEARKFGTTTVLAYTNVVVKRTTATQTIANGSTISGSVTWQVTFTGITPYKVDMLIDNVLKWTEYSSPWGDSGPLDTTTLSNGSHIFKVNAYDSAGSLLVTSSVTATVSNIIATLPPAPSELAATAGDKTVTTIWGAISLATYKVYRNGVLIASPTTNTFIDTGLTNGQQYSYQVSAVNVVGEGPKAGPVYATPTGSVSNSVTVNTIAALKSALLNDTLDEIVVANGTYTIQGAFAQQANSLYIGAAYASRTRPILIRAQTQGGVTISGNGMSYFGAICFVGGAHHQTWDGFNFANGTATETGVIVFGGPNASGLTVGPHHITMRNIVFENTIHGYAYDPTRSNVNDHCVYFADASSAGEIHDILMENVTVNGAATNPVHTAFHFYTHGFGIGEKGSSNVVMRNWTINGVNTAIILWDDLSHDILVQDVTITNSRLLAVRYEEGLSTSDITLQNVTTTNSGLLKNPGVGFYSSQGANPPGLTRINCSFDAAANPPPVGTSQTVSSISALKTALLSDNLSEIIVTNGTYFISNAASKASNSLWIGSAYAGRTRPIVVRAQTNGGVIFDGQGSTWFGGITFAEGARYQTWRGFKWTNATPGGFSGSNPSGTGVITIGGYANLAPPHHITLEDCEVSGLTDFPGNVTHGHAVYVSMAANEGPHHLAFTRCKFNSTRRSGATDIPTFTGALHFFHDYLITGDPANHFNAHDVTITDCEIIGSVSGVFIWARTIQTFLIDGLTITGAKEYGIRYEGGGGITLRDITTTNSGITGFAPTYYVPNGPYNYPNIPEYTETGVGPANIVFDTCSFDP